VSFRRWNVTGKIVSEVSGATRGRNPTLVHLTQAFTVSVGALGITAETIHQTVVTDSWVSASTTLIHNPLVEMLSGFATALAQSDAVFVHRFESTRGALFHGTPLRIVVTARSTHASLPCRPAIVAPPATTCPGRSERPPSRVVAVGAALDAAAPDIHIRVDLGDPPLDGSARMEQRIGFGKRLGALVLDCIIVWVLAFFGGTTIGGMLGLAGGAAASRMGADDATGAAAALGGIFGAIFGFVVAAIVIAAVYFLIEGLTGYTLGKLILGIRVANADGTAAPVGRLLGRFAIKNSNSILLVLSLFTGIQALVLLGRVAGLIVFVGCFLALGVSKQALHDRLMGTAVYPRGMIKPA
jgi:uncharacterized RDD family membrane protein YckC